MIIKNSEFTISAVKPAQYPTDNLPQIVLVGKSNVGKSSFINTMLNRARTSSQPGKTRLINFYKLLSSKTKESENQELYFVDLPGYGYSKMSKTQQIEVGKFIEQYLTECPNIHLVIFLIDIRHNPTTNDKLMYDYIIKNNLPCIIITSKADKIAVTKVDKQVEDLQEILNPLKDLKFLRRIYTDNAWSEIEKYI